ncbi:hypothetical protein NIE88_21235 [Sporolactobacillus shoreicorticis]|uniref:Transposase n=1 Tax=Sporolactobacillus shoreicorticis TaxID=1923877 RepID=A0ABW5RZX3_9BACL|nr:hypothetical protein [Sporolactobacillus shoreicorticis]MCO7128256.1 hypothetical protein [Sporolactobacillus shoreicorticis]
MSGEDYFVDGTKVEANANRYTFVWKKAAKRYQDGLQDKVKTIFRDLQHQIKIDDQALQNFVTDQKKVASA